MDALGGAPQGVNRPGRGERPRCVQGLEAGGQAASGVAVGLGERPGGAGLLFFLSSGCSKLGSHSIFCGSRFADETEQESLAFKVKSL